MAKSKELEKMREKLITTYPSGVIRGQMIADMPECQIYAIYKSHIRRRIPTNKPRLYREKQIPGQMCLFTDTRKGNDDEF